MVPFARLQSTSQSPPLQQANPMYNNHVPPREAGHNAAALFASSMLGCGDKSKANSGNANSRISVNVNENNNSVQDVSKHLLSEFSDSFKQMSLNSSVEKSSVESAKSNWASFD